MSVTKKRKYSVLLMSVLVVAGGSGSLLTPKKAEALVCANCASEITQVMNNIELYLQKAQDAGEYAKEGKRWLDTLKHYQRQLINLQHKIMSFGMPNSLSMNKVPDDYGVAQRCGGGGFSLARIAQGFNLSPNGNLLEQRTEICASIQIATNRKYNETIEFVEETIPELERTLQEINARRDSSQDMSVMDASQFDAAGFENTFNTRYRGWEMRMNTYDSYIASMQAQQRMLTEIGLKGENNPLGTLVKTASLKAALTVGK